MARYDKLTKDFMDKVAFGVEEVKPPKQPKPVDEVVEDAARKGLVGLRGLREFGTKGLLFNTLAPVAAEKMFNKTGGVSAISTYEYLNNIYDTRWWDWEPETLWKMLKEDEGIDATDEVRNIVMALQTVLKSNAAHEGWHIFENVCQAFNGNTVDFSTVQPAELTEIALTLKVLNTIRPKQEFDEEIWIYIATCARDSGVVYIPPELFSSRVQPFLDDLDLSGSDLKDKVRNYWTSNNMKSSNPSVQIQLARLNEIKEYVEEHHA